MGMGLGYDDKMFLKVFNSRAVNGKERQMYVFSGSQPRYVRWQCIVKDVFGVGIGLNSKPNYIGGTKSKLDVRHI